jgi:hypothetical protein
VKRISSKDIDSTLKKLISEDAVETILGSMATAEGTLVLLFSPRLNKDFPLLITSQESSKVLSQVYETLAQNVNEEFA